jgi:hypothetical protein
MSLLTQLSEIKILCSVGQGRCFVLNVSYIIDREGEKMATLIAVGAVLGFAFAWREEVRRPEKKRKVPPKDTLPNENALTSLDYPEYMFDKNKVDPKEMN